jgi:DUF4097 and DUF4098 domain-containing protein YvlB
MRLTASSLVIAGGLSLAALPAAAQTGDQVVVLRDVVRTMKPGAYQGRNNGPEQTERFSRKVKIGRDGRFTLQNISGDITVTAGSGDEVSIDAIKRTRGDKSELDRVQIRLDERGGRVDVQTDHGQMMQMERRDRNNRGDHVSVDYTIVVPASVSVDLHSISGGIKVTGVRGSLRSETISGNVTITDAPRLEAAKTVSGDVMLTGVTADGDLSANSISGSVHAKGLKARGLDLGSVSGDINVSDVTCERLGVKTISGSVEYAGGISKGGRYEINAHSGSIRLVLANPAGFELNANSFSGSIRSELPLTIGGDASRRNDRQEPPTPPAPPQPPARRNGSDRRDMGGNAHSMRATFGDGSATLVVRTFSGDIVIAKR